jgi:hypothetical protein
VPCVSLNFLPWAAFKPVKRIKLEIALGVETEFVDRDRAFAQLVSGLRGVPDFPW